jgi:hypothetical protein
MQRAFKVLFVIAWIVGIGSWFPLERVEDGALSRPDHPTDQYSRPLHIKGVVRYVTPTEELVDGIAYKAFMISWLVGALAAAGIMVAKRIDARRKSNTVSN